MTKTLNTDQKIDLILQKVTVIEKNQNDLIKTVGEIAILSGKTADKLDGHAKQTNHAEKSDSFTPFTSGAFVA
jgi:hypothetical protein